MNWKSLLAPIRLYEPDTDLYSADPRSAFEQDYHTIITSASFRRLQDKTQVFPLDKSDFIRTRLTHSMEVSSIARSLGQMVSERLLEEQTARFDLQMQASFCSILQCAGLIHDIGNPPFGHFGETTIREWFRVHLPQLTFEGRSLDKVLNRQMLQDFYRFEGNAQALRLVTRLHFLSDEHGMNLTCPLLASMIKYPISSVQVQENGPITAKKPGYFFADRDIFSEIEQRMELRGRRHPLTFLLEAADDIAYLTADIEDACRKGYLRYDQLLEELYSEKYVDALTGSARRTYLSVIDHMEQYYRTGREKAPSDPSGYAIANWIVYVQQFFMQHAADGFLKNYSEIMDGSFSRDLFADTEAFMLHHALGDIAYRHVFISRPIFKLEISAATVLEYLLDKYISAVIYYDTPHRITDVQDKLMTLISDNYKAVYARESANKTAQEKLYLRLLLITDSICGMTDGHAKRLYQELNGIDY
ncbi:MAG: deoxyguanosinetriphosphate triphosphohydrolase [Eubacteriales bacterium]|nr:deoxyguanosinetriphosphate triphosphohydrolase [Eubacteriales bacterium]